MGARQTDCDGLDVERRDSDYISRSQAGGLEEEQRGDLWME